MRKLAMVLVLCLSSLTGCNSGTVNKTHLEGEPTVYATVTNEPNPILEGCWHRVACTSCPHWGVMDYCLVKKNGKYAFYYYFNGRDKVKGWKDIVISGDQMSGGALTFFVKDGSVWMQSNEGTSKMVRFEP